MYKQSYSLRMTLLVSFILVILSSVTFFLPKYLVADSSGRVLNAKFDRARPTSLEMTEISLNRLLEQWGTAYHFRWFIDRRLDPDLLVSCSLTNVPLTVGLATFAQANELSFCFIGSNVYIGPKEGAGTLLLSNALLAESLKGAPRGQTNQLLKVTTLKGDLFCQPRQILEKIASSTSIQWDGLERMPLDCWNVVDLTPFPLYEQMGLILTGFDVRSIYDATHLTLRPVSLSYGEPLTRVWLARQIPVIWEKDFPQCHFERTSSSQVRVSGCFADLATLEYQIALATLNIQGKTISSESSNTRLTGTLKNKRIADVFTYLREQLHLTLSLSDQMVAKGITPDTRISCEFRQNNQNEVVKILAHTLRATWRQKDREIIFYPIE